MLVFCLLIPTAFGEDAPLLYRVTDGEGHTLYLFGTIHVGDDNTYDLVHTAYETLLSCDVLAMEIDPIALQSDTRATFKAMASLYLKQGDDIANYFSEQTVKLGYASLDQPKSFLSRIAPVGWLSYVQNFIYEEAGLDPAYGADWYIAGMAYSNDIRIEELETYDEQITACEDTSVELLDFMIGTMLSEIEKYKQSILDIMKAWSAGDETELARLIAEEDEVPESLRAAYEDYMNRIQFGRDDAFLEDAVRLLKSGDTAMIAIGAAHIFGERGLAARLRALGYAVEIAERYVSASAPAARRKG